MKRTLPFCLLFLFSCYGPEGCDPLSTYQAEACGKLCGAQGVRYATSARCECAAPAAASPVDGGSHGQP